jgi:L-alanine-DL-glutamate epimerase-like enolase superfamily enzyme
MFVASSSSNRVERIRSTVRAGRSGRRAATDTDVRISGAELYLLPVQTRVPLKFGPETLTEVTCARVRLRVTDHSGHSAWGWGETPLNVQWAWPSELPYAGRRAAMLELCQQLVHELPRFEAWGHPLEIGYDFLESALPRIRQRLNEGRDVAERLPHLASLVCASPFDLALHDAYGLLHGVPTYSTYSRPWMNHDLEVYFGSDETTDVEFRDQYPESYFDEPPHSTLSAWRLVGGLDPLDRAEVDGEPRDALPQVLDDWITRDGLTCLKIKLRGNDAAWDYDRIVRVGQIALARGVRFLSIDFNCTVTEVAYVTSTLDRLATEQPAINDLILYVEQPFAYELSEQPTDVRSVSMRKPLFMDESAHDWRQVRLGRALGWTGVALKTCKTQTGAVLSLCWAKAHGMDIMVQDLTNPMLAQIPHVLLAAHAGTLMGVETNAMQFYPQASVPEAGIHPGLYARIGGQIDLATIRGPGFGYNGAEAARSLPEPSERYVPAEVNLIPPWHAVRSSSTERACE